MEPPAVEHAVGMEVYYTSGPGLGGRLRVSPEDFIVEELSLPPPRVPGGMFVAARIKARNWETNRLVREMSRCMGISRRRINFAGTKDKRGVKVQMFTFLSSLEQLENIRLSDVDILERYQTDRPLELGTLMGNRFELRLRGTGPEAEAGANAITGELGAIGGFPNFFGIQRFGAVRPVTHIIGKHLVRGDIEGAVMSYIGNPIDIEANGVREARARIEKERDFLAASAYFPSHLSFEKTLIQHLAEHAGDWAGALRQLPLNLLMMFVHAYQSCLFNRMLSRRIKSGMSVSEPQEGDVVLPLDGLGRPDHDHHIVAESHNLQRVREKVKSGRAFTAGLLFGTETPFALGAMGEIEHKVIEEEGLKSSDFNIPDLKEVSSKGTRREFLVPFRPGEPKIWQQTDAIVFEFSLPRGCYATALLREYMKGAVLDY